MASLKKKKKVKNFNTEFTVMNAFMKGDIFTRMSSIIWGLGNIARKQIVKGLLFLIMEITFVVFFFRYGISFISGLITLGTKKSGETFNETLQIYEYVQGDNSMLFLLYGIFTLFVIVGAVFVWRSAMKSAYEAQYNYNRGQHVNTFKQDIDDLFNGKIHRTLLFLPVMCVIVFTILPLIFMISMAFTNYDRLHQPPGQLFNWVGFDNFGKILSADTGLGTAFWHVLGWTLIWAVFATVLNYLFGMILALVINRNGTRFKSFWRFIFILSIAVPQFVSLLVLRLMLDPDGAVNVLLRQLGLIGASQSLPFWTNATWARISIIVVNLWIGIPYTMLQTTGILKNIPGELYESAKIDGANAVYIFFKITLPYMMFVMTPYLITQFIGNINNFNVIYLLTKGAPAAMEYHNGTAGKTDLLVTWLYKLTIDFKDYNLGAVIGILVFVLSATFTLITYRRTGSYKREEEFQ